MGVLSKILRWPFVAKAAEGSYRPGPYTLWNGGTLSAEAGKYANWWQLGYNITPDGTSSVVEACISTYAQTVAMCAGDHWKTNDKKGRERQTTSALSRLLRKPNNYQSMSDLMLNLTDQLYRHGNAYVFGVMNARQEFTEIHLMGSRQSSPRIAVTGDIFYNLGGNEIVEAMYGDQMRLVPQRYVMHVRLHTPNHPLNGVSPLVAAMLDVMASNAMTNQQIAFWQNMARPSFMLGTDLPLKAAQVAEVRELWDAQTKGLNAGGTPILTAGLKPLPIDRSSNDSQLAEMMKMSDQHIAMAFRMPPGILGLQGAVTYGSAESLMQAWRATGLGFALNHIEEAFGQFFGLYGMPTEYVEFSTDSLVRSAFKDRIEGLVRGVQGGVFAINEARNAEGYESKEYGDDPRVQQQLVPLSYGANAQPPDPNKPQAPAAAPAPPEPVAPTKDWDLMLTEAMERNEQLH